MTHSLRGFLCLLILVPVMLKGSADPSKPFYPNDIKVVEGSRLLIAHGGTRDVVLCKFTGEPIRSWKFNESVTGLAVDQNHAWVTSSDEKGFVTLLDLNQSKKIWIREIGLGARAPVLSKDKKSVYVAVQFKNAVCSMEAKSGKIIASVKVLREPFAMAITPDGRHLFVNNFLPAQRADMSWVSADVSVIDLANFTKIKDIKLSNGSNALRGICVSPDGKYVYVTHNLGRYTVPTSQLEQGWMNTSGLSVLDVQNLEWIATIILDEPEQGAAGSWDIQCNQDLMIVTHSGTHDLSVIDQKAFLKNLLAEPDKEGLSYNLNFLAGIRRRIPVEGNGPRTFTLSGNQAYIPTYFSDHLNRLDLSTGNITAVSLNPNRTESNVDRGKRIFNDATHCFQGWQSCNGCHPGDARTDGLNWDLLNDGMGNPKNCKSMLFAYETPPVMISGIRPSAEVGVRAGFKHIQYFDIPEEEACCVDDYLKSLTPLPSPWLVNGKLKKSAKKGKKIFDREGCSHCHNGDHFTDLKLYKIGDGDHLDREWKGWDTPTLREVWRTAPYLHDGSAYDMRDVFEVKKHGLKKVLTPNELEQLTEYVNSL